MNSLNTTEPVLGHLAQQCGMELPLAVYQSAAGFYLGTWTDHGPYTRESVEYWPTRTAAELALASGEWTQKPNL
jgi:hypothetical protein